jgi:hypothetical protein
MRCRCNICRIFRICRRHRHRCDDEHRRHNDW